MAAFDGKKGLILGVATEHSLAWAIAQRVMTEGGHCGFSHLPDRSANHTHRNRARVARLVEGNEKTGFLIPVDVTSDEDIAALAETTRAELGRIDFLLHSIAFADMRDLAGDTIHTSRAGFKLAMDASVFSLIAVCGALADVLCDKASVLTMTYFGGEKAVPGYNVMGICKAALEAAVRYLAVDLGARGIRVNALSAGPIKTLASSAIGVDAMMEVCEKTAPLRRNVTREEIGRTGAFLLSDSSDGITGEVLHTDAGYNIMGSPGRWLGESR